MRRILLLPALLITLTTYANSASPKADEEAIRQLVARYVDVRNHMDESVLRSLFTQDADQLVSTGQWRRGIDSLAKGAVASSSKETGHSTVTLQSVRLLGKDSAIADGIYETSGTAAPSSRKMWSTFVLQRTKGGWKITAIRNMLPAPAAQ